MTKRNFGSGLFALALAAPLAVCAQQRDISRPNVLLIYADDLGYGDLECYGAKNVSTPNVNSIAANGVRFTNAYAAASTSTPSRYALLTGEYPWRKEGTDVAAGNAAMIISPDKYTVADMFSDAGYSTAVFGKWHLGLGSVTGGQDWNDTLDVTPADIGFAHSYIMAATADRVPCVFIEDGAVSGYDASAPIQVSYRRNFEGEPTGRDNLELLYNLKHSHGHDMSIVNGIGRIGYMKGGGTALWKDENIADSITARAVRYIDSRKDEPFFIYFATNDVHVPRFPHERFRGMTGMGHRGDAIAQFDWCVGELLAALKRNNLLENTLIIVTSDNGAVTDDGYADRADDLLHGHDPMGGLRGGKYSAFEAGARIPMIVSLPGVTGQGVVSNLPVSQIDFLDVMSVVAGVSSGHSVGLSPDGMCSEVAAWLGSGNDSVRGRSSIVAMASNHTLSLIIQGDTLGDGWKYIEPSNGAPIVPWGPEIETGYSKSPQLYRMRGYVIDETVNEASAHPDVVEKMDAALNEIRNHPLRGTSAVER